MTTPTAVLARIAEIRRDPSNYRNVQTATVCIRHGLFRDDGVLVDGAGGVLELVNGVEEIARLEKATDTPDAPHTTTPAAALLAFVAWLSGRDEPITIGKGNDCAPIVPLIGAFCRSQGWVNPPDGWEKLLKPYPTDV